MKKGPLSKVEQFYIANNQELGVEKLSQEIDKSKDLIQEYLNEIKSSVDTKSTTTIKKSDINNMFAKRSGAVIMTEGASQLGDSVARHTNKKDTGYIHTIREKK